MFTDKSIKALKPAEKPYREFEKGADKGFGVQITPKGEKSFFIQYLSPETGKRRFMKLGSIQDTSLVSGREQCRAARALVDQGVDPQIKRDKEEAKKQEAHKEEMRLGTVQNLFDDYISDMKSSGKRSWDHVQQTYDKNIKPYIATQKTLLINNCI